MREDTLVIRFKLLSNPTIVDVGGDGEDRPRFGRRGGRGRGRGRFGRDGGGRGRGGRRFDRNRNRDDR